MQSVTTDRSALKSVFKTLLLVLAGIMTILLLLSGIWNYIVKTHLDQLNATLPSAALEATQEALTEKAAYKAAEYRAKRVHTDAQSRYELEKLRLRQEMLPRYSALRFYALLGFLTTVCLSLLILAAGYAGAKLRKAAICYVRIDEHCQIPIHLKDLSRLYPSAANLHRGRFFTVAPETGASLPFSEEPEFEPTLNPSLRQVQGNAEGRSLAALPNFDRGGTMVEFGDLLRNGMAAPGKRLVLGYTRAGKMQYGELQDLKTLAVAGLQGSGKRYSMAYLIASGVLATGCRTYVIDPHKHHPESLAALIRPLEQSGLVSIVNPFDTPTLIHNLNQTLDRRLRGEETSAPPILLVIDELARLATMDCFNELLPFLKRCAEEIGKANIVFIGSSHKWTTRHFKGRADIRRSMNSMLIHRTKPSQANLLMEDAANKNLVKQIKRPGEAILVTDYGEPTLVSFPRCKSEDMRHVVALLEEQSSGNLTPFSPPAPAQTRNQLALRKRSATLKLVSQA